MEFFVIFVFISALLGYLIGLWATKKGYNFWNWFFASSVLGFLWLAFSRNTVKELMSEEMRADIVRKGNTTGIVLSCITVLITLMQFFTPKY